uniref:Uncharacterized protein n=1 Tax=Octopus bimaculoides TaxID=37653 RepID=A0A0L8FMX9_OCTBM
MKQPSTYLLCKNGCISLNHHHLKKKTDLSFTIPERKGWQDLVTKMLFHDQHTDLG